MNKATGFLKKPIIYDVVTVVKAGVNTVRTDMIKKPIVLNESEND